MTPIPPGLAPDRFAAYYRPVSVASPSTGPVSVAASKYLSCPGGQFRQQSAEPMAAIQGFYERLGNAPPAGVRRHSKYVLTIPELGLVQVDVQRVVKQCHMGKGTPTDLQAFALLYTYWDKQTRGTAGYKPSANWVGLQHYTDEHLGVDCNGFAGAYYGLCFPQTKLQPHSVIVENPRTEFKPNGKLYTPNNSFGMGARYRTGIEQVRAGDVIVFTHKHVAVIGDCEYLAPDTGEGTFWVYQAKNYSAGGVQGGLYDITYKGNLADKGDFSETRVAGRVHAFKVTKEGSSGGELVHAIARPKNLPEF